MGNITLSWSNVSSITKNFLSIPEINKEWIQKSQFSHFQIRRRDPGYAEEATILSTHFLSTHYMHDDGYHGRTGKLGRHHSIYGLFDGNDHPGFHVLLFWE
jgi:hypothetical protein